MDELTILMLRCEERQRRASKHARANWSILEASASLRHLRMRRGSELSYGVATDDDGNLE
jgi:hypothetical protein